MKFLQPNFNNMPAELIQLSRWVCWKDEKVPYNSTALNSKASVINEGTWATFEHTKTAYEEGGYEGVGFVLNGDGIVGIDIDDCVSDGKPSDAALQFMENIGCQYVELSPSGNGLHGFGYVSDAPKMGRRGTLNELKVELYSIGRYLTITGHTLTTGPLGQLSKYHSFYDQLHISCLPTEVNEDIEVADVTEEIECNTSISSSGKIRLPVELMPTGPGQRNRKVFHLARHLKCLKSSVSMVELMPIVQEWHNRALPVIRTKDWHTTWIDFCDSWDSVKYLSGTLDSVMSNLPELPPDCAASEYGPHSEKLFQICIGLQQHEAKNPFFLSCTIAGKLIGIDRSDAAKLLKRLCKLRLLQLETKGVSGRASRYRVTRST